MALLIEIEDFLCFNGIWAALRGAQNMLLVTRKYNGDIDSPGTN